MFQNKNVINYKKSKKLLNVPKEAKTHSKPELRKNK